MIDADDPIIKEQDEQAWQRQDELLHKCEVITRISRVIHGLATAEDGYYLARECGVADYFKDLKCSASVSSES